VTSELENQQDPISQDQARLDLDQQPQLEPQGITTEELAATFTRQNAELVGQVAGLQSKIDRGLDAIRRDSEERVEALRQQSIQAQVGSWSEEVQETAGPLIHTMAQENAALKAQIDQAPPEGQAPPPATPPTGAPPTGATGPDWSNAEAYIRRFKLEPSDSRIQWGLLTAHGRSQEDQAGDFTDHLLQLASQDRGFTAPQATQATQAPQAFQAPQSVSPPIGGVPTGGGGMIMTEEEVSMAYISDQIDKQRRNELLAEIRSRR